MKNKKNVFINIKNQKVWLRFKNIGFKVHLPQTKYVYLNKTANEEIPNIELDNNSFKKVCYT